MDWIGLDIIWSPQAKGSVLTLSYSSTGKQEQTTFTERKRQGNMQDPVTKFRLLYIYLSIVGTSFFRHEGDFRTTTSLRLSD